MTWNKSSIRRLMKTIKALVESPTKNHIKNKPKLTQNESKQKRMKNQSTWTLTLISLISIRSNLQK